MCNPKEVHYTKACGHYYMEKRFACTEAKTDINVNSWFGEAWTPCNALIYELERQRNGRWGWTCVIGEKKIEVFADSSAHCDSWQTPGYQKPDYTKLLDESSTKPKKTKSTCSEAAV